MGRRLDHDKGILVKRLSGLDASFLYLETPAMHLHVSSLAVFDPRTAPERLSFDRIVELTEARLHLAPMFRRRLVTVPFELHHPVWIEDPDFDIRDHMFHEVLPAPGDRQQLAELAGRVNSVPLDRHKPLWEMSVVEGLADGNLAVITKTHHAAVDGVSGMELTVALLDLERDPPPVPPPDEPWEPEAVPDPVSMLGYAVTSLARQPLRVVRALPKTARAGLRVLQQRRRSTPDLPPPPFPFQAPRTPLNVALGPDRTFAWGRVPLDELKSVKRALGGTLNDVVLAVTAGGLLRWLEARDEVPDRSMIAMMPISVRTEEQAGAAGNQVSSQLVSLATDVADPVERLHAISASTAGAKEAAQAIGATTLQDWAEFAAPALAARAARLYSRTRIANLTRPPFNLTISNVPGPPFPLYSFGAEMVEMYPLGPVSEGSALNVTVASYQGDMTFGLLADADAVPDPWEIGAAIEAAAAELVAAARAAPGSVDRADADDEPDDGSDADDTAPAERSTA